MRFLFSSLRLALCICMTASIASELRAAPPTLTHLFPAGAARGHTVEVSAGGTFAHWPMRAWTNRKGVEIEPAKNKGKFTIAVAADVVPDVCWIRLHDDEGASELRPFLIGTLPEVLEKEPNNEAAKPHMLAALPVVVNGRLEKNDDVDCFAFHLSKGQTLIASLQANRTLESPMDGILQLLSADGFVCEENNDERGLDPQIVFTATKDGVYVVRVFAFPAQPGSGIRFAGAATYIYRLTLTTGGFADHALPSAVKCGVSATVEIAGWNIPAATKNRTIKAETFDPISLWHPQLANTLLLVVEPHRCIREVEPNDRKKPQSIELPATICGRVDPPGDRDVFTFSAKKGQRLSFRLDAGSAGSRLAPLLRLTDASGKRLAQTSDSKAGKAGAGAAVLAFMVPRDGSYRAEVSDEYEHGGLRHFYRLRIAQPEADYALTLKADRFTMKTGKSLDIPIAIDRRNGFAGVIEIRVEGLLEGVTAKPVQSTGKDGKTATLKLEAKSAPLSSAFHIVGRVAGKENLTRTATAPRSNSPQTTRYLWLTATK